MNVAVYFLTQNEHKFREAKEALAPYGGIILKQLAEEKPEYKDDALSDPLAAIASRAAKDAARQYGKTVVAEDAGIFFEAYRSFPGLNTKWIIKRIGYDGIFRLLKGLSRKAYFRSVVALCEPDSGPICFEGMIEGRISEEIYGEEIDCMDYDRIFIPDGSEVPFALMMNEKNRSATGNWPFKS